MVTAYPPSRDRVSRIPVQRLRSPPVAPKTLEVNSLSFVVGQDGT